jgi:hypothetical protein
MSQKTQTILIDDIDGGHADLTMHFAIEGNNYEIDLSTVHANELSLALSPYINAARRIRGDRSAPRTRTGSNSVVIRAWAAANGIEVNSRGRIPKDVVAKYESALADKALNSVSFTTAAA